MNIVVGLSGGVDSAVAAFLLKEQGHNVVGAIMTIWDDSQDLPKEVKGNACYGPDEEEDIADAKRVAEFLDIPFHAIDCSKEYSEIVLTYFKNEYCEGRTPNPCVMCNQNMKFGILPSLLAKKGVEFDAFATGHYCQVEYNEQQERYMLKKGNYSRKDQSYFLYRLTQKQLKNACFPLGMLTKKEVREIAKKANLPVKFKAESQDFYSGDYSDLISKKEHVGNFVDRAGTILGKHKGIWNYTIGQRKGLGIGHCNPLYVVEIKKATNEVVVGEKELLKSKGLYAKNINMIYDKIPRFVSAKLRSGAEPVLCEVVTVGENKFTLAFDMLQTAVTPGQSVVLYDGDYVVAGGVIENAIE